MRIMSDLAVSKEEVATLDKRVKMAFIVAASSLSVSFGTLILTLLTYFK